MIRHAADRQAGSPGRLVPVATTLLFAVVSVVPLHIPGFATITPAFALMAVYHWTIYRPDLFPPSAVFALGLLLDLLSGTPYVGTSSLVLLLARAVVLSRRRLFADRAFPVLWSGFLAMAAGTVACEWAILGLMHGAPLGVRPFAFQAVLTVACFPVGSYLLGAAHGALPMRV